MLNEWVAIRQFYGSPQTQRSRAKKTGNHFVPNSSQMSDAGWPLGAGVEDVGVLSDAWGWPKRHCFETKPTIPDTYFLTYCFFSASFKGSSLTVLIPIFSLVLIHNPCSHQGVVFVLFQNCVWGTCVSDATFVSFVPVAISWGVCTSVAHKKTANSHILPLFWLYLAEWWVSFFLGVGGRGVLNSTIQGAVIIWRSWLFDRQLWIESWTEDWLMPTFQIFKLLPISAN